MIPIIQDNVYYIKALETFTHQTKQFGINYKFLEDKTPLVLRKVWDQQQKDKPFSVLSVGGGTGETDVPILTAIASYFNAISRETTTSKTSGIYNRVLEPRLSALEQYKALALPAHATVTSDFRNTTFQCYIKEQIKSPRSPVKFDMVHFIHTIYFVTPPGQDLESVLRHTYDNELGSEGVIMIMQISSDDIGIQLHHHALEKYAENRNDQCFYTDADTVSVAKKNSWEYDVFPVEDYKFLDVTDIFAEESVEGNIVLDFLTQYKDFRATASRERLESTLELIRSCSREDESGKLQAKCGNNLVVIYKGDVKK